MPPDSSTDTRRRGGPSLPGIDREVLDLGVRWAAFGGASAEDIFVLFGWSENQYFERLQALTDRYVTANESLRQCLTDVCGRRLMEAASRMP